MLAQPAGVLKSLHSPGAEPQAAPKAAAKAATTATAKAAVKAATKEASGQEGSGVGVSSTETGPRNVGSVVWGISARVFPWGVGP